jgi:hypothetical protein
MPLLVGICRVSVQACDVPNYGDSCLSYKGGSITNGLWSTDIKQCSLFLWFQCSSGALMLWLHHHHHQNTHSSHHG